MDIVEIGSEVLRRKAVPVQKVTKRTSKLIKDMIDTMYAADGVGLAAPQVGRSERVIVVDVGEGAMAVVNPEIVDAEGDDIDVEGCLSVPDVRGYVKRRAKVVVEGIDQKGKSLRIVGEGLLARVLQHEIDHLNGVLFVDEITDELRLDQEKG